MYYENLFNQNYINGYQEELKQRLMWENQIKFATEQQMEILKTRKALNDFLDAMEKIAPQYQGEAMAVCVLDISQRLNRNF